MKQLLFNIDIVHRFILQFILLTIKYIIAQLLSFHLEQLLSNFISSP
jgi:hypothetical protein